jgi:RNA polymerase sigma factor (sigma-70 family)
MANGQLHAVMHHLRRLIDPAAADGVPDAELLERFVRKRDAAAFELLVRRHERMVHGVCRRVLGDADDADDAFQATFLVFVRKAGSISKRASVAGWLYRVAYRVALRARAGTARRAMQALPFEPAATADGPDEQAAWRELRPLLDAEVNRLPEKYRVPIVLCYLESRTYEEAARQLGCSRGTLSTRLTRARELLRRRLTRRGLVLTGGLLAALLAEQTAPAAVPAALVNASVEAAMAFAAGNTAAGLVSAKVLTLTQGALNAMLLTKLKVVAALLAAVAVLGLGTGALTYRAVAAGADDPKEARAVPKADPPPSGLDQATRPDEPAPTPRKETAPAAKTGSWQERATLTGQQEEFMAVAFSPDARLLVTAALDGNLQLWDVASAKELRRIVAGSSVYSVAFSPDGKLLASGGGERGKFGTVKLWDLATGKQIASLEGHADLVVSVAFAPDARTLAAAGRDGALELWDVGQGKTRADIKGHAATVFAVAFSPDGKLLASAGGEELVKPGNKSGEIRVRDTAGGREVLVLQGSGDTVTSVAFAPDGRALASGGFDKTVRNWDITSGKERWRSVGHDGVVRSVAFSPDAKTLASASFDGTVRVWDAATGKEVAMLKGMAGGVMSVAFSPDARLLAAAGGEPGKPGWARLWAVAAPTPQTPAGPRGAYGDRLDQHLERLNKLLQELVDSKRSDQQVVEALYLATLTRFPAPSESEIALDQLARQKDRREGLTNILWALVNTKEFTGTASKDVLEKLNRHDFGRPKK